MQNESKTFTFGNTTIKSKKYYANSVHLSKTQVAKICKENDIEERRAYKYTDDYAYDAATDYGKTDYSLLTKEESQKILNAKDEDKAWQTSGVLREILTWYPRLTWASYDFESQEFNIGYSKEMHRFKLAA